MDSVRFRTFNALKTSLIRLYGFQYNSFNRVYSKASKYYGGYNPPAIGFLDTIKQSKTKAIEVGTGSTAEKVKSFKAQLNNFEEPLKKYDFLMALRDQDLDLYYHFLRANTGEVLTILYAVDGVIQDLDGNWPIGPTLMDMRKHPGQKPLDISKAMEHLRQRIKKIKEIQKQNKKCPSDAKRRSETKEESDPFQWIKKQFMISPNKSIMIYLMTNNLK